jgi:hypothetical protein
VNRHPYFDLYLHDEDELGELLGSQVIQRQTLQEWPLSCVQRITTQAGRKLIYKSQHAPTVEPEFYARARSSLLVPARTIYREGAHSAMFIDEIDGPTLAQLGLSESKALELGRHLLRQIAEIKGDPPHYLDISNEQKWRLRMGEVLRGLKGLVEGGAFHNVQPYDFDRLEHWAFSKTVLSAWKAQTGYVHNDLSGDNVFMLPDGPRLIDWQRPVLGPTSLDLAQLMESLGYDPLPHVGEGGVWLMRLLRIGWFTDCTLKWFPDGQADYDRQIEELIKQTGKV